MADPYTIHYGPWSPDLANVAVEFSPQSATNDVPCADCLNVYYADGCYQSLQGPATLATLSSISAQPPFGFSTLPPLGAFTGVDATGNPVVLVGTTYQMFVLTPGTTPTFNSVASNFDGLLWRFAQYGQAIYAVDGSSTASINDRMQVLRLNDTTLTNAGTLLFVGSITSNVLTVTSLSSADLPITSFRSAPSSRVTGSSLAPTSCHSARARAASALITSRAPRMWSAAATYPPTHRP